MGWDACTLEPNAALRWLECHPAFAAASQDTLLLIAIGVALGVPLYERVVKNSERRKRSEAFAAALFAPASEVMTDMKRVRAVLGDFDRVGPLGLPETVRGLRMLKIIIPEQLMVAMMQLHEFDNDVVGRFRTCMTGALSFNSMVDKFILVAQRDLVAFHKSMGDMLRLLHDLADTVRENFESLVGLPKSKRQ